MTGAPNAFSIQIAKQVPGGRAQAMGPTGHRYSRSIPGFASACHPRRRSLTFSPPQNSMAVTWAAWQAQLASGLDQEQFEFLRAMDIRDAQADLDGIVARVHDKLARHSGYRMNG